MKTKFLKRVLWLMIPLLTIFTTNAWGEELFSLTSYDDCPSGWTCNGIEYPGGGTPYFKFNEVGDYMISPLYGPHDDVNFSYSITSFGSGTHHNLTVYILDKDGNTLDTQTTNTTTTSYASGNIDFGDIASQFKVKIYLSATGRGVRLRVPTLTGDAAAVTSYTIYVQNNCSDGNSYSISGAGSSTGTYGGWANTYSVTANTQVTLGYTEGAGQTFDGWGDAVFDESSNPITVTNNKVTVTKDVYVYCNFSASCTNGTVTYAKGSTTYTGGNTITGSHANSTKICETNLTLPGETFYTTGYTQDGWATSDGGSKVHNLGATNYSTEGDATLYPHWVANQYTVIWKSNGSIVRTDNNVNYQTAKTPPTISPLPCGDKLAGWTDAANGAYVHGTSTLYTSATITITGDKTFYAVFADYDD